MKRYPVVIIGLVILLGTFNLQAGATILEIESAPVFATNALGAGQVLGAFGTIYSEAFPFGTPTNVGSLPVFNANPPGNFGFNFWIKSAQGAFVPPTDQIVVQLEGTSIGGNGGMFDIANNILKHDGAQAPPAGKIFYRDQVRVSVLDLPFTTGPTVLTSSRIQNAGLLNNFDPAVANVPSASFANILDDDGFIPAISSSFGAGGLDLSFDFPGSLYVFGALEDSALRIVLLYQGGTFDGGGGAVPLPGTFLLVAGGLIALTGMARRQRRRS